MPWPRMPEASQVMEVKTGPACQVEDSGVGLLDQPFADEADMRLDQPRSPARSVVFLAQVLGEDALTEGRVVPGDVVAFGPGLRRDLAADKTVEIE